MAKNAGVGKRGRPRSQPLPGMEDARIRALEDIAAEYATIRDQRMTLTRAEVELKARAMQAMHRHGKTAYLRDGIEIRIVPGEDDIKVRVKRPKPDDADDADATTDQASAPTAAVDDIVARADDEPVH